jgi:hypothetical protein
MQAAAGNGIEREWADGLRPSGLDGQSPISRAPQSGHRARAAA